MATRSKARIRGLDKLQKKLRRLQRPVSRQEAERIGELAVTMMKDLISKGLSPITGPGINRRFPPYKWAGARGADRRGRYPWSVMRRFPGKRVTPVNLELSGDFLADLSHQVVQGQNGVAVSIGYSDPDQKLKEKGHRQGANSQPRRPTIPIYALGEKFASRIEQAYLRVLSQAVKKAIDS